MSKQSSKSSFNKENTKDVYLFSCDQRPEDIIREIKQSKIQAIAEACQQESLQVELN
jgi:hypothetical protein